MDLSKFEKSITKTGFSLEYQVSEILRNNKWTVINNKYYVDDVQQTVREIDLLAYKTINIESIVVYTALIISCKKNEEHAWGLLAKDKDSKDPNINWHPISNWSNNKIIGYMLNESDWLGEYLSAIKSHNLYDKLIEPNHHIFAFQEMDKSRGTPKNDKSIFASISSLMKAEGYEIESLSKRKKYDCLYNFNLISVVETELVKLLFRNNGVTASIIGDDKYIGSYIINKNNVQSRIHFINSHKLNDIINDYNNLHKVNGEFCTRLIESFYKDAIKVRSKRELLKTNFINKIKWRIHRQTPSNIKVGLKEDDYYMHYNEDEDILEISFCDLFNTPNEEEFISKLNNNNKLNDHISRALKEVYRYEGDYTFVKDDFPF